MNSKNKKLKWLCLGDIGWDIYFLESDNPKEARKPGGISLNHLVHLSRFQEESFFYGALSNGPEDYPLECLVNDLGVKLLSEIKLEGESPKQYIKIGKTGEKNFFRYEVGVLEKFDYKRPNTVFDYILLPVFSQNWCWAEKVLENPPQGKLICDLLDGRDFDQNFDFLQKYQSKIELLVVGCPSEDEAFFESLREGCAQWSKTLLVTRGDKQGFYFDGKQLHLFSPDILPINKIKDSTGAGDAFLISFLVNLSRGTEVSKSLRCACLYAGEQLQKIGAH